jgi:hypothetical protein
MKFLKNDLVKIFNMKHDLTLWYSEYLIAETALITPLSRQTGETRKEPQNMKIKYRKHICKSSTPYRK